MRVKNKSDLSEFPDGGRATLVRRYSPAIAREEKYVRKPVAAAMSQILEVISAAVESDDD